MTTNSIDIYQKLADFKKQFDDSYNKTSAIFNEPAKRLSSRAGNSPNPNVQAAEAKPVKIENVKIEPAKTPPATASNARIIDLTGDRSFTTDPPSRISIKYRQKRLANRRRKLMGRRRIARKQK